MEFLKEILGEELYSQVESKINEYNGAEANKDKQVKIGNLGGGEYVGRGKYDALNEQLTGKQTELDTANTLIADLKKASKGNEDLQGKIGEYETQVADLQKQLAETKLKSALRLALTAENAADVDYLTFKLDEKLKEEGKTLELDENGRIRGWDEKLSALKTQYPKMFESEGDGGYRVLGDNRLPEGDGGSTLTKSEILKKPYAERAALYAENPEAYNEAMNK
ncbi:MAG: phage scaffolding protein [Porcipelethomonas sp.]